MAKVIGMDLGTTNSVVAVMEADTPTFIVKNEKWKMENDTWRISCPPSAIARPAQPPSW